MKVSITEIAKLTGMDRRRIAVAMADLTHTDGPKGAKLYESQEALAMLYAGGSFDDKKEKARLTHHQANLAEIDERVKRGELLPEEIVTADIQEGMANFRAKILNMPPKLASLLAGIDDAYEAQAILEDACHEALTELSNQYVSMEEVSGTGNKAAA